MRILAFERGWWRFPGAKEREILEVFGMPATRYYQLLNELIDRPEAAEFDPVLVARLRRQRSRRHRIRSARPGLTGTCPIAERPDGPARHLAVPVRHRGGPGGPGRAAARRRAGR